MRRRFTNEAAGRRGDTVVMTTRVLPEVAEEIARRVGKPGLPNKAAIMQDALALWVMLEERAEEVNGNGARDPDRGRPGA